MTKDELEELYVYQLRNLAMYYGITLKSRMLKADIVKAILDYQAEKVEEPPMSARVKLLKKLNRS